MTKTYNKVLLIGNVETEVILRRTTHGTMVTNFTITTVSNQIYKKWHHITCWGKIAERAANSLKIGDDVFVEGLISYRQYEKNNKKLKVAEIKAVNLSKWEGSLNKIIIIGNTGSDLVLRKTTNDVSVTNFALNTTDNWCDRNGKFHSNKKWYQTVCWGKTAELAVNNNIKSGSPILVEGSISYKTHTDKDGVKNNHIAEIKASQLVKWTNNSIDEME